MRRIRLNFLLFLFTCCIAFASIAQRTINEAEYFIDTDPGPGNGSLIIAEDGNLDDAIEDLLGNGITVGSVGLHTFNVRIKDSENNWGPVFKTVFYASSNLTLSQIKVSAGELYWDTDPGQGSGTPLIAYDGNFNDAIETLSGSSALPASGMHVLNLRVKDANNNWGPVFKTVVNVTNAIALRQIKVSAAELFWDTDPGLGSGTPILAFDGNFDSAFEALSGSSAAPANGLHVLHVRVRDAANNWGPVFKTVVNVSSPLALRQIKISSGELFWDVDPGYGLGTPLLAFDGNFNDAFEALSGSLAAAANGVHVLNVRVRDALNSWGPVFKTIVNVTNPLTLRQIKVSSAEFFFDGDPGQGQGTPMLAFDGNFDDALETVSQSWTYLPATGLHLINVRAQDVNGNWGPVFKTVLNILPCVTQPTVNITPSTTQLICPGDVVALTADPGFVSYTWFKGSTIVGTGQNYSADTAGFYHVYAIDANGCPAMSASTEIGLNLYNANITASGATTFCSGGSVVLTASSGNTSYSWNTGSTAQSITVASSGTYIVTVSNGNCLGTDTVIVTVNPNPATPVITSSGPTAFCAGDSVTLTSSPAGNYTWNTNEYTQSIDVGSPGTYTVTVTDVNNCTSSASVVVTQYPNPISSISNNVTICEGDSAQLTVSGGVNYLWVPATGLSNANSASPMATPPTSQNYMVYVTGIGGCLDSASVSVFVNPVPTAILSASDTTLCEGNSLNLFASPSGATSYNWSGPAGFFAGVQNPTINSLTIANSGLYTLNVANSAGCQATDTLTINVVPGPTAYVSANSVNLCAGDLLQLESLPSGMASYSWIGPNGFNATSQDVIIDPVDGSNQGTYTVSISNGICSSSSSLSITVYDQPVVSLSSSGTSLCDGSTLSLYASSNGTVSYQWSGPNGFSSADQNPFINNMNVLNAGLYTVTVTNPAGCQASDAITINVVPAPTAYATANSTDLCVGETLQLQSSPNGMTSYVWTGPNGFTSASQDTVIVSIDGNDQGVYTITMSNGTCSSSASVTINVHALPTVLASANSTNLCEGSTLNLTASPSGATAYEWSGPNGFTSTDQNPVLNNTVLQSLGTYVVTAFNSLGCTATDDIFINITPGFTPVITGSTSVCEGSLTELTGWPAGMATYEWIGPNGYSSFNQQMEILSTQLNNMGMYTLTANNGVCTAITSVNLEVRPLPNTSVTQIGSVLTSEQYLADYQWVNCLTSYSAVTGETSQSFTSSQNGDFAVILVLDGCIDTSACYTISGLGLDDITKSEEIIIYPNPANTQVTIAHLKPGSEIRLNDLAGKLIYLQTQTGEMEEINVATLVPGVYLIEIHYSDTVEVKRLVINR